MLQGFSGHLISESYLERWLDQQPDALSGTVRIRRALLDWRSGCRTLGPASGLRSLLEIGAAPLARALGYDLPEGVVLERDTVSASLRTPLGLLTPGIEPAPIALIVSFWGARLETLWRAAVTEAARRGAAWCLLFNGTHVRLVNARRLYSRRWIEFDLDMALDDERAAAALSTLFCSRFALGCTPSEDLGALVTESDRHATGVCRSLRDGVLEASSGVLAALVHGRPRLPLDGAFEQSLTIVYRILFLLFAEARHLVPLWHPVYRESYSLDTLRAAAERQRKSPGLWDALRAVTRLAHAGCRAGDLRITPFNGRLFAPSHTPLADRRDLDDNAARDALITLSTRPAADRGGRERIAYRDLGVEQLGAVYETLLDYTPELEPAGRTVALKAGAGIRKETGTFYTPQPLARFLVRRTLAPLVKDALPERILALRVLDPAMGSGAFLVSACAFLSEAYEAALVQSGACLESDLGPADQAAIRRTIAERCLYGVDLNPMAVQLARLSLWLASLAADRPLSFLDHHLMTGDSLVGAWLGALRHHPATRRPRQHPAGLPLFDERVAIDALRFAVPVRFMLTLDPTDTPEQVRRKDRALATINETGSPLSKWKRIADLWCSTWFADNGAVPSAAFGALADSILEGRGPLSANLAGTFLERAHEIASARRFFHWELEFPEAFFDPSGARLQDAGFDAVLGNPPWDMVRADSGPVAQRHAKRGDTGSMLRFTRDSGTYSFQSDGHANRYQLFVERAMALVKPSGRIGLVLPSGFATDHGSGALRRRLLSECEVDALVGFDNHDRVFPIHRSVRFLLMTASRGRPTTALRLRLGERSPAVLESDGDDPSWFPITVAPSLLERLSGPGLAIPDLRSPSDLTIAEHAATRFLPFGDTRGWGASFGRELNATDDRAAIATAGAVKTGLRRRWLPVVEGKHLEPFRADLANVRFVIDAEQASRRLGVRHLRPRLAYRDVASATNRATLIAALLPAHTVSTHTLFCLRTPLGLSSQYFLSGILNSFVVNYLARMRVATHVTTAIVEWLPVPTLEDAAGESREIAALARLLAHWNDPPASARLNALVARLYGLSADEFAHILTTFPLVPVQERAAARSEFAKL